MTGLLLALPIVLPLVAAATTVLLGPRRTRAQAAVSGVATAGFAVVAALLVHRADDGRVHVLLVGNWAAPFGIALALDRVSALLLALTAAVALAARVHAQADPARRGTHFEALFQCQLMGLAAAFLTADLFNLFVAFELLLAASYGLLLHGGEIGRRERLAAALRYVSLNLAGSALFLVAAAMLYGVAGTLNLADLAVKLPHLEADAARLAQAAIGLLLVVFALKAALLPLSFWLPDAYGSAGAAVAALFALLTKVGVYAIARTVPLLAGDAPLPGLAALALATVALAALGALAATRLRALAAQLVIGSSGTLVLCIALRAEGPVTAGLFYLLPSTVVAALWFLLAERVGRARGGHDTLVPLAWSGPRLALGAMFAFAAVAAAGLPPLAPFIGKVMVLQSVSGATIAGWATATLLLAGLALLVAMVRAGTTLFWAPAAAPAPAAETAAGTAAPGLALALLAALVLALTFAAGPVSAYAGAAARQLLQPQGYVDAILGERPAALRKPWDGATMSR